VENNICGALLTVKTTTIFLTLLLSFAAWAGSDYPQPTPLVVFEVTDIGKDGAPVAFSGTANAYVKLLTEGRFAGKYMLWDETLGMRMTNTSNKPIVRAVIEVRWWDVRGMGRQTDEWKLDFSGPDTLYPGQSWTPRIPHTMGYRHTMTPADYTSTRPVAPVAKAHVTSVGFVDGTTYSEPEQE
jgi:hypothetical protein